MGIIISKLASTDLIQQLDSLERLHREITVIVTTLKAAEEHAHSDSEQLANLIKEQAGTLNTEIANISARLTKFETEFIENAKATKTRSIVIMFFVILGSFSALGTLITLLLL